MSQADVQIVRGVYEGWARGDFSASADVITSDFEYQQLAGAVEPGSHRGASAGGAVRRIFEVDEKLRVEAEGGEIHLGQRSNQRLGVDAT